MAQQLEGDAGDRRQSRRRRPSRTPSSRWRRPASCSTACMMVFNGVTGANTNPDAAEGAGRSRRPSWPRTTMRSISNPKLFQRVATIYKRARLAEARSRVAAAGGVLLREVRALRRQSLRRGQDEAEEAERRGVDALQRLQHQAAGRHQGCGLRHHRQSRAGRAERCADRRRRRGREGAQDGGLRAFRCRTPRSSPTWPR